MPRTTSRRVNLTIGSRSWCARRSPEAGSWLPRWARSASQLTGRSLLATFVRYPFVTLKVIGGIHWEALKLWRKGAPSAAGVCLPPPRVTIVRPAAPSRSGDPVDTSLVRGPRSYSSRMSGSFGGALERRLLSIVGNTIRVGRSRCAHPTAGPSVRGAMDGPAANVDLHDWRLLRRLTTTGAIGLADGYIAREYDSPDLSAFLELAALHLEPEHRYEAPGGCTDSAGPPGRSSAPRPARAARCVDIVQHYDLGNDFYDAVARRDDDLLLGALRRWKDIRSRRRSGRSTDARHRHRHRPP